MKNRAILALTLASLFGARVALAGEDDANKSGIVGGHAWSAVDGNNDGLPETVIVDGTVQGIPSNPWVGVVSNVRVCVGTASGDQFDESQSMLECVIFGGRGDDTLIGSDDEDDMFGGAGDDTMEGHSANDDLFGGSGAETLKGNNNADWLFGGTGADFLFGDESADHLEGESDNDYLRGGNGTDYGLGGDGDDLFDCQGDGSDYCRGDDGADIFETPDGVGNDEYVTGIGSSGDDDGDEDEVWSDSGDIVTANAGDILHS